MASAKFVWCWLLTAVVILLASVAYANITRLPAIFKDFLAYGKVRDQKRKWTPVQLLEVPKQWFFHFYLCGVVVNVWVVYNTAAAYMLGQQPNHWLDSLMSFSQDSASIDAGTAILLMLLMVFQVSRRLLECLCVSVYSKSTINVAHYILGVSFYTIFPFSVLSESPDWHTYRVHDVAAEFKKWRHLVAVALFLWASWQQNRVNGAFAQLRKNTHGEVMDLQHRIPQGGWFEYVSCPHYFMEVLIYLSMLVATGFQHVALLAMYVFVVTNQTAAAYITHQWYRAAYPAYPRDRKALVPHLL